MFLKRTKRTLIALGIALAGIPLSITATCDPYTGFIDIYRYDDNDYWYDDDHRWYDWPFNDDYYYDGLVYIPY